MRTPAGKSDGELVRAALARDVASIGALLERHRADMHAVALAVLGHRADTHDAVQDAMISALTRIDRLRDADAVGPWLRAIVRNVCRMRLRSRRTFEATEPETHATREPALDAELEQRAAAAAVLAAVDALSDPLQLVTLLRHFSGLAAYEQIAEIADVPVGTVRSRLHQARRLLDQRLRDGASAIDDSMAREYSLRVAEFDDVLAAASRGEFPRALAEWTVPELELVGPQGQRAHGRGFINRVMQSDLDAGVRQRRTHVAASRRFAVVECELVSPPWDPHHCPPSVVWLLTFERGRVGRIRLFHPRPLAT